MKHWLETRQVATALAGVAARSTRAALATVVSVVGSAYRHPGAKLLVTEDGLVTGNVSGGCLELDVRAVAEEVIATGHTADRTWCGSHDQVAAWDLGVGCAGEVRIIVEPIQRPWPLVRGLLDGDHPFAIITRLDAPAHLVVAASGHAGTLGDPALDARAAATALAALTDARPHCADIAGVPCFIDVLAPPPHLLLAGAGDDAAVLANLAHDVGFAVTVTDRRPHWLTPERFRPGVRLVHAAPHDWPAHQLLTPRTWAVAMAHHYADDREALRVLLDSPVAYIGMLGPRARTARMLADLAPATSLARVHGPVGLDIGTDGAEQVALAVLAEILALRSGRGATSLRERTTPIHATA